MRQPAGIFKYKQFDASALCDLASGLRGGQPCFCNPSQNPKVGSLNWAIIVSFTDGVEWMLRSPRDNGTIQSDLLASEAATLKFIEAHSTIPVPKVFAYRDNDVGIPYILMSKADGVLLQCKWKYSSKIQRAKILSQLGRITWELSGICFDRIGSLFEENETFQIKSCLSRGLVLNERSLLENLHRGPFVSEHEYYDAHVSAFLQQAMHLPLGYHCFFAPIPAQDEYSDSSQYQRAAVRWSDFVELGSKIDGSDNRLDYIIAGRALSDMLSKWTRNASRLNMDNCRNRFPIYHPDISVNNIFVDDEFNITCIIDWAFCSSVPLPVLLTSPGLPQSQNRIEPSLLLEYENGFLEAHQKNTQQKENEDIGQILKHSRPMWLFSRLLNFDCLKDYELFKDLWDSINPDSRDLLEHFASSQCLKQNMKLHDKLREEDVPGHKVALQETRYFGRDVCGLAISRKLTLISEWSLRYQYPRARGIRRNGSVFVADRKLWMWIDKCILP